jgi:aspartyl-tRNA(Asn)/glutamyl-tRNA(Gln) amidotransferase subunit B
LAEIRSRCPASYIALLAGSLEKGEVNAVTARRVFDRMTTPATTTAAGTTAAGTSEAPNVIIAAEGLAQISDESAIAAVVGRVLAANEKIVAEYKAGKKAAFNSLMGSVMRETKGKANPQVVRQIFEQRLAEQ